MHGTDKIITAFPFTVFVTFGSHWCAIAYVQDPFYNTIAAFSKLDGAAGAAWATSQAFHNVVMTLVAFVFLIATFRVNVFFVITFFGLVFFFAFIAAAQFALPSVKTAAELEHVGMLLKVAGGFGFLPTICGWYLAILTSCAAVGIPCPLPVLDLSTKVFAKHDDLEHAKGS